MNRKALLEILGETRALLARPDSEFTWSSWNDQAEALSEIDGAIARLSTGEDIDRDSIRVLFLPTGDLQEVSISSRWGDYYLRLARRFDRAIAGL